MESDAVYNSPEEVIVNDIYQDIQEHTKSIPRVFGILTLFSLMILINREP